jgi:hypothetical protein
MTGIKIVDCRLKIVDLTDAPVNQFNQRAHCFEYVTLSKAKGLNLQDKEIPSLFKRLMELYEEMQP